MRNSSEEWISGMFATSANSIQPSGGISGYLMDREELRLMTGGQSLGLNSRGRGAKDGGGIAGRWKGAGAWGVGALVVAESPSPPSNTAVKGRRCGKSRTFILQYRNPPPTEILGYIIENTLKAGDGPLQRLQWPLFGYYQGVAVTNGRWRGRCLHLSQSPLLWRLLGPGQGHLPYLLFNHNYSYLQEPCLVRVRHKSQPPA